MKKENFKEQLKEAQKEPKQLVVGSIILLVAILLIVFSFVGEKTPFKVTENVAPKPLPVAEKTIPAAEEVVVEEVVVEEVTPEAVIETVEEEVVVEENPSTEPETSVAEQGNEATEQENAVAESEVIEVEPEHVVVTFTATLDKDINFQVFYTDEEGADYAEETSVKQAATPGTENYSIVLPAKHIYRFRLDFGEYPGKVAIKDIHLAGSQTADLNDFSRYDTNQIKDIVISEDGSLSFTSEEFDPYIAYKETL